MCSSLFRWSNPPLLAGRLVRRTKRFLADVKLDDGTLVTAHTSNTGSMLGCAEPGSAVYLSRSDNPKRKLAHTWEAVRVGRSWVSINTLLPNRLLRAACEAEAIPELAGYGEVRAEVPFGESSRVDLLLEGPRDRRAAPRCYVEIKNVTLADQGVARFPDAVTSRGQKHLRELMQVAAGGDRAVLLFFVGRTDCQAVGPADAIDREYGRLLREAVAVGVEVLPYGARFRRAAVELEGRLPLLL